jgi:hypothetical protein
VLFNQIQIRHNPDSHLRVDFLAKNKNLNLRQAVEHKLCLESKLIKISPNLVFLVDLLPLLKIIHLNQEEAYLEVHQHRLLEIAYLVKELLQVTIQEVVQSSLRVVKPTLAATKNHCFHRHKMIKISRIMYLEGKIWDKTHQSLVLKELVVVNSHKAVPFLLKNHLKVGCSVKVLIMVTTQLNHRIKVEYLVVKRRQLELDYSEARLLATLHLHLVELVFKG